jgi:hypothetical protein
MADELERMCKEAVIASFKALLSNFQEELRKTTKHLSMVS